VRLPRPSRCRGCFRATDLAGAYPRPGLKYDAHAHPCHAALCHARQPFSRRSVCCRASNFTWCANWARDGATQDVEAQLPRACRSGDSRAGGPHHNGAQPRLKRAPLPGDRRSSPGHRQGAALQARALRRRCHRYVQQTALAKREFHRDQIPIRALAARKITVGHLRSHKADTARRCAAGAAPNRCARNSGWSRCCSLSAGPVHRFESPRFEPLCAPVRQACVCSDYRV
jgi:hypothetical protein